MPHSLSISSIVESNRLSSDVPWIPLIEVEIIDPLTGELQTIKRFARSPEDVSFGGFVYERGAFDVSIETASGQQAQVTLTINDYTQTLRGLMEANGGGVGSNVALHVVNSSRLGDPAEISEYFQIVGSSAVDHVQTFILGAENALAQPCPRRRQTKDFCQWRYKDPATCGYSGGMASCDLTLQGPNGCAAHGNSIRFGGFPGLNSNGYRYT